MECELMHKGEPVAVLDIGKGGHILGITNVVCIEHMPPGTVYDGEADPDDLRGASSGIRSLPMWGISCSDPRRKGSIRPLRTSRPTGS